MWIYIAFLSLSGSLAAVSNEVIWLLDPAVRATAPGSDAPLAPYSDMAAAATAAVPGSAVAYLRQRTDAMAVEVILWGPGGGFVTALVNPYTATVQKVSDTMLFQDVVRSLHGWLLMPWQDGYSLGYYAVAVTGLPLLVAVGTGLVVYRRFWQGFLSPRLRIGLGARIFWGDLHRLIGLWSLWFLLLTGLTALWFLVQAILWHTHTPYLTPEPELSRQAVPYTTTGTRPAPDATQPAVDRAVAAVQAQIPGLSIRWIGWPEHTLAPFAIAGTGPNPLFNDRTYGGYVNPWGSENSGPDDSGPVLVLRSGPADLTAVEWVDHLADPLHYGSFGGVATKILWALLGLAVTVLSFSGMLMWRHRTAPKPTPSVTGETS